MARRIIRPAERTSRFRRRPVNGVVVGWFRTNEINVGGAPTFSHLLASARKLGAAQLKKKQQPLELLSAVGFLHLVQVDAVVPIARRESHAIDGEARHELVPRMRDVDKRNRFDQRRPRAFPEVVARFYSNCRKCSTRLPRDLLDNFTPDECSNCIHHAAYASS